MRWDQDSEGLGFVRVILERKDFVDLLKQDRSVILSEISEHGTGSVWSFQIRDLVGRGGAWIPSGGPRSVDLVGFEVPK